MCQCNEMCQCKLRVAPRFRKHRDAIRSGEAAFLGWQTPLVRHSSKTVDEKATKLAVWSRGTVPDPGLGALIELASRHTCGEGDLGVIGETRPGVGDAAQEGPPGFDEVEPSGPDGNEDLLDARVRRQPLADRSTGVTGEGVGNEVEVAVGMGAIDGVEQVQRARGMACRSGLGADRSLTDTPRALDPGLVVAAAVDERGFEPM